MTKSNHPLEEIKWSVIPIINYRGILIEKMCGGYRVFGKLCSSPESVDEAIDNATSILSESITVVNDGSISCQNSLEGHTDTIIENEGEAKG